jgi:ribosomal protein L16 Arg81 hydroxylase
VLTRWLSEGDYRNFAAHRAGRMPFAQVGVLPAGMQPFGWETLDRVLADRTADVLVVRKAELLADTPPRNAQEVRALFARGAGVVVRRAERHEQGLGALAASFARELDGSAHIQLFVTPGKTHGFGWHYDEEDVCILQTEGTKTYYFRNNTQEVVPGRVDFTRIRTETSPLMTCTLAARDMLYLPRYMWHAAKADEDSLSISLGVR